MKDIDKIIRENVDFFNNEEPFEGHFERFSAKLKARQFLAPKKVSIVPHLLKAAVVTVLVAITSLWTWEHVLSPNAKKMSLSEVSSEYAEVEQYYVKQVNLMEDQIQDIWINGQPDDNEVLLNELDEMDKMYEDLQKDLKANPNDERVINAMIEHYENKVKVMNYILSQLKQVQNQNENQINNENYETVRL
ncbi:MAG TPA: hypothetical protein DEQ09_03070 [Bacteroidales bacterium]|nr:hypothetical protein [Bacteroidales bacterium]